MPISQDDLKKILMHFARLTKDMQVSNYNRNHRVHHLREKNLDVLNTFFRDAAVCFEEADKKNEFQNVVGNYFQTIQQSLQQENEVKKSVEELEAKLLEQKDKVLFNRFLSVLADYQMS